MEVRVEAQERFLGILQKEPTFDLDFQLVKIQDREILLFKALGL